MYKDEIFTEQCQIFPFTSCTILGKLKNAKAEKWGSKLKSFLKCKILTFGDIWKLLGANEKKHLNT